jgi:hypothetical protein
MSKLNATHWAVISTNQIAMFVVLAPTPCLTLIIVCALRDIVTYQETREDKDLDGSTSTNTVVSKIRRNNPVAADRFQMEMVTAPALLEKYQIQMAHRAVILPVNRAQTIQEVAAPVRFQIMMKLLRII